MKKEPGIAFSSLSEYSMNSNFLSLIDIYDKPFMICALNIVDIGMGLFFNMTYEMPERCPATGGTYKSHLLVSICLKGKVFFGSNPDNCSSYM